MTWEIAKRQLLLNILTFRFAVATAVCVLLVALLVPILIEDYKAELQEYGKNVSLDTDELRKVRIYKNIQPTIYRPPSVLALFSKGVENQIDDSTKITLQEIPEMSEASSDLNPFLSIFPVPDVSLILAAVVSILAILLAYDAISGDRERGTLKLMFSGPLPRHQVLLGRLISGALTLLLPITMAFIVAVLMLELSPMVRLTGSDWLRIGLMYIASLIFVLCMYNLALFFSCVTRKSSTSLMFSLFSWVIFVAIIPNAGGYLAAKILPLEPKEEIEARARELWREYSDESREWYESHPYNQQEGMTSVRGAFESYFIIQCSNEYIEWLQQRYAFMEPQMIRRTEKVAQVWRSYLNGLFRQKSLADLLSRISPVSSYRAIVSALARTDTESATHFFEGVKELRAELIQYIRSETDDFSAPVYFSRRDKELSEEAMEYRAHSNSLSRREKVAQYESLAKRREKAGEATPPLDLSDLPVLAAPRESVTETLGRMLPALTLSILLGVFLFVLSFAAFVRYDVR